MRRVAVLTVLIALLVLAGCGGTSSSHSSPASGDLPPVWVQREAM